MSRYARHFGTIETPQSEAIPGKDMSQNTAGGFGFTVTDWHRLERFLILGNEDGTYYASESKLTKENAECILRCIAVDPNKTIDTIVEISEQGRAPKNSPAIFALAVCAGQELCAPYALKCLPRVCRIGTHLFEFAECVQNFRGWGRSLRRAIAQWYTEKRPKDLAYQVVKYQQRNGWTHRDLLRLCHAKSSTITNEVLAWVVGKPEKWHALIADSPHYIIAAHEMAKTADVKNLCTLIREHNLPRECVPSEHLSNPEVNKALLERMPMTAMIRNLGNMTRIGAIKPLSTEASEVERRLLDDERLRKARIHPLAMLTALKIYGQGHGMRGKGQWDPVPQITSALDDGFYKTFKHVEPTGKNYLLGIDVSSSMSWGSVAGSPLSPAEGAAAMAMTIARTEKNYHIMGFAHEFRPLGIHSNMSLGEVLARTARQNFGATDCALPMTYALDKKLEVDVFVVVTDNETYFGQIHPCQALEQYRRKMNRPAKLAVIGMTSTEFTIADPNDVGMMDFVGYDSAAPQVLAQFSKS